MKAVIIDDLEDARLNLRADLEDYCPEMEILGEADGVVSGVKLIKELNPEIVFLDIQMNDGSGFDLLEIVEGSFQVIFTTASDAHAIQAFRFAAVDYLMKPIDPDDLKEAVDRAKTKLDQSDSLDLLKEKISSDKPFRKLALHTLDKIHIKDINSIVRCESSVNYTTFFFSDETKLLVTKTLKEYDKMLSDHGFYRVHQSHLINGEFVKEYVKSDGGYLVMKDGSTVPVSTRKKSVIMEMIEQM